MDYEDTLTATDSWAEVMQDLMADGFVVVGRNWSAATIRNDSRETKGHWGWEAVPDRFQMQNLRGHEATLYTATATVRHWSH